MTEKPDDDLENLEIRPLASPACEMQFFEKELFGIDPDAEKNQPHSDNTQGNDSAKSLSRQSEENPTGIQDKDS